MNKFIVAFFVILFLFCAGLGYVSSRKVQTITARTPDPIIPADQVNLVLVRVDDLSRATPALVSIWGVFISHSVSPSIILKQIFSDAASPTAQRLAEVFSLDGQKKLSTAFSDLLHELELPKSAVVLVDNNALSEWTKSILGHALNIAPIASPNSINISVVQKADRDLFKNLCTNINGRSGTILNVTNSTPQSTPDGNPVYSPDYLRKWMGLVTSLHFTSCQVLVGP